MPRRWTTTPAVKPVQVNDVFDTWSEPFMLAPGHRLRGHRCAICAMLIGPAAIRNVTIVDMRLSPCGCGSVPTATYLVCSEHPVQLNEQLASRLHERWLIHHGHQPCTVNRPHRAADCDGYHLDQDDT